MSERILESSNTGGFHHTIGLVQEILMCLTLQHGFTYHHAKPEFVMMVRWLPVNEPNNIPRLETQCINYLRYCDANIICSVMKLQDDLAQF